MGSGPDGGSSFQLVSATANGNQIANTPPAWLSGVVIALSRNLMNNLPAGLIAGNVLQSGPCSGADQKSSFDLVPNLSITGSLATILWLVALRREDQEVSAWTFLKLGSVIMTTTMIAALALLWI